MVWIDGPKTPDPNAESELAVVEIDNKQPGLMENAIGKRLKPPLEQHLSRHGVIKA